MRKKQRRIAMPDSYLVLSFWVWTKQKTDFEVLYVSATSPACAITLHPIYYLLVYSVDAGLLRLAGDLSLCAQDIA